jgi:hypothetical protein
MIFRVGDAVGVYGCISGVALNDPSNMEPNVELEFRVPGDPDRGSSAHLVFRGRPHDGRRRQDCDREHGYGQGSG